MGFVIKKIVVHSEPTRVRGGEAHYNMVREKWDVRNLLEVSSKENETNFILNLRIRCNSFHAAKRSFHGSTVTKIFVLHIYLLI